MTSAHAAGSEASQITGADARILTGAPLDQARLAAVLIHGRGQDEGVMLDVIGRLAVDDVAYALPTALGQSWYPSRYFEPLAAIEPHLSWSLDAIDAVIDELASAGIPDDRIVLGGFSQGACLAAQFAATRPRRLAGVAVLTGSLLGPRDERPTPAGVEGLPLYICSSRHDTWVHLDDVEATAQAFAAAGARVTLEVFDDREHLVSDRAVAGLHELLTAPPPRGSSAATDRPGHGR
jgi:phospholipase/carboxylesterase